MGECIIKKARIFKLDKNNFIINKVLFYLNGKNADEYSEEDHIERCKSAKIPDHLSDKPFLIVDVDKIPPIEDCSQIYETNDGISFDLEWNIKLMPKSSILKRMKRFYQSKIEESINNENAQEAFMYDLKIKNIKKLKDKDIYIWALNRLKQENKKFEIINKLENIISSF